MERADLAAGSPHGSSRYRGAGGCFLRHRPSGTVFSRLASRRHLICRPDRLPRPPSLYPPRPSAHPGFRHAANATALVTTDKDLVRLGPLSETLAGHLPLKTARLWIEIDKQAECIDCWRTGFGRLRRIRRCEKIRSCTRNPSFACSWCVSAPWATFCTRCRL